MKGGIVPKFCPSQKLTTYSRLLVGEASQVLFKAPVDNFRLPAVCRWYAVLILTWFPYSLKKSCQINIELWTLVIDRGIPWSWAMISTKSFATFCAVYVCDKAVKWAYFVRGFTTTIKTLVPTDIGQPSIKSNEISSHSCVGIGNGWSNPEVSWLHICCAGTSHTLPHGPDPCSPTPVESLCNSFVSVWDPPNGCQSSNYGIHFRENP